MQPDRTIADTLRQARQRLAQAGCDSPALDARLLLQHVLSLDHAGLIAAEQACLSSQAAAAFETFLARRLAREPVARILGRREFFGRDFALGPDTLDPRPDTEILIETALALAAKLWPKGRGLEFADLGTGSGAILVSLLAELPEAHGVATDISPGALRIAAQNARRHAVADRASFLEADWFSPLKRGPFGLIVSNPPYIEHPALNSLAPEVTGFDPVLALDGGPDGLSCYRAIARQAPHHLRTGGYLAVEIGPDQALSVSHIFENAGFSTRHDGPAVLMDLAGRPRVVCVRKA